MNFGSRSKQLQPERRSRVRVVTLKNAGWFVLAAVVLFFVVTTYTERRARDQGEYGRLYERRRDAPVPSETARPQP
ncbi:MAG TPA: hypothetical protein VF911_21040 [Thermoanaerobaculia bacterium]|jgi:prophage antirepressor-like protein